VSRWFRFYEESLDDPKVQRLPGETFKSWVNLLSLASKNDGVLPSLEDVAFCLRIVEAEAASLLDELCARGLLDPIEVEGRPMSYEPHNWRERQYKSDKVDPTAADRQKSYRDRNKGRNGIRNADRNADRNATVTVTATRAETETEQIQKDSEANASGAVAPRDYRVELFGRGLQSLASMTGKGPDACRSFVGKCLKAAGDDAVTVLGLIEDAERNQVVDPSAWIAARLKGPIANGKPPSAIIQAADNLRAKLASFDGRAGRQDGLRSGEGAPPPRLLSNG
jgi:hypothetical protein